jgi:hypothetical protein
VWWFSVETSVLAEGRGGLKVLKGVEKRKKPSLHLCEPGVVFKRANDVVKIVVTRYGIHNDKIMLLRDGLKIRRTENIKHQQMHKEFFRQL